jgi:hypothetical protein
LGAALGLQQDPGEGQHARMMEKKALSDVTIAEGYEVTSVEVLSQAVQGKRVYEAFAAFRLVKKKKTFNKEALFPFRTSKDEKLFICGTSEEMQRFLHYYAAREGSADLKLGLKRADHAQPVTDRVVDVNQIQSFQFSIDARLKSF